MAGAKLVICNGGFDGMEYPITADDSRFALDMLAGAALSSRTKLFVQFLPPGGEPRVYEVHGGHGWLELDPSWYSAAWSFVRLGFQHILDGIDHLLFLLCLVLPFRMRQFWTLAGIITSFTVAHSITLIAGAAGLIPAGGENVGPLRRGNPDIGPSRRYRQGSDPVTPGLVDRIARLVEIDEPPAAADAPQPGGVIEHVIEACCLG